MALLVVGRTCRKEAEAFAVVLPVLVPVFDGLTLVFTGESAVSVQTSTGKSTFLH